MKEPLSVEGAAAILAQARAMQMAGSLESAATMYKEVAALSDDKNAVIASVEGLQACGKETAAIIAIEDALNRWPISPMIIMRAVTSYESMGNPSGAARHLRTITQIFPDKARYWLRLGKAYAAAGNWQEAESAFAQTLALAPLDPAASIGRGDVLVHLKRIDEAIVCYRRIARILPDHAEATLKLGNLLSAVGDFSEAIRILRIAVANQPKSATAHIILGSTLHYAGRTEEGLALCRKALSLEPNLGVARESIGILLLESGHINEATEILAKVDRANASIPGLIAMYTVARLAENTDGAERTLQSLLTLNPQHSEARHLLAALHREPLSQPVPGFVESIFARLAHRYDQRMTSELAYQMPQRIASALSKVREQGPSFSRWLDLGCGTGLMASALNGIITGEEKIGVDISETMLNVARRKNIYSRLIHRDVNEALPEIEGGFDLITAADMLPYFGSLTELFTGIAAHLTAEGVFACTYEHSPDGQFRLSSSGRFSHSPTYVENTAMSAGLKILSSEPTTLLYDSGEEAAGFIGLLSPIT